MHAERGTGQEYGSPLCTCQHKTGVLATIKELNKKMATVIALSAIAHYLG